MSKKAPLTSIQKAALQRFALDVLQIMETESWEADTLGRIELSAQSCELSTTDRAGFFKTRKPYRGRV